MSSSSQQGKGSQQSKPRETRTRRPDATSAKQVAYAAMNGHAITFRWLVTQPSHEIIGYVVGSDAYHWLVASVLPEEDRVEDQVLSTHLIHKASPSAMTVSPKETLSTEGAVAIAALEQIGGAYWEWCAQQYSQNYRRKSRETTS